MEARNRELDKGDYKGRMTQCIAADCPCKPCWNPHDCGGYGTRNGVYQHIPYMACLTNWVSGCPEADERKPEHKIVRGRCVRCGWRKPPRRDDRPFVRARNRSFHHNLQEMALTGFGVKRLALNEKYETCWTVDYEWCATMRFRNGVVDTVYGYGQKDEPPHFWSDERKSGREKVE
jgi:hypothetical protein